MAKTYYSTKPIGITEPVAPPTYSETPKDYLNAPGDYYLRANPDSGNVTVEAGGTIYLDANGKVHLKTPLTQVDGNTILGSDIGSNWIELKSKIRGDALPDGSNTYELGNDSTQWKKISTYDGHFFGTDNVENPFGFTYDPTDVYGAEFLGGSIEIANLQREQGSVYIEGGVGIQKDLNVGGHIYGRITLASTSLSIAITSTNIDYEFLPIFARNTGQQFLWVDEEGIAGGLTYNPLYGRMTTDRVSIVEFDPATSTDGALMVEGGARIGLNVVVNDDTDATTDAGAVLVAGGISVGKNVWINQDAYVENTLEADEVLPHSNETGNIGTSSTQWAEAYVQDLYTRVIRSTTGTVKIDPQAQMTEIIGDINVRGVNPIGTAPVVTNVLYVTVDGNDTNDGRAQDPSRACRTVGGAINSPYYQPGTQILVSPGHYLEDNPIRLKPYTSIRGSDIRTTFIEPINKTQDLFHLDSGCYLNYMTFLNGRSGLLDGPYAPEVNRGAYATAFPPLTGEDRIDLFHSPYVQNCTNQSGPWLKDGTMFVPNQTVQVPSAVATGTWAANTTTLVVNISTGTIVKGMAVNAGQQDTGFFNARTLMLANKPFLQEQVVAYVDQTFNSGAFSYNTATCQRDIGLILDSISLDLLYNSNSESIFAGLQYWSQGDISFPGELTTTTQALQYLGTIAAAEASSAGGATQGSIVSSLFSTLNDILSTSSNLVGITDSIVSNGLPSSTSTYVNAYDALIAAKSTFQTQVINWITTNHPNFVYSTSTCARDVGYIVDSVAFDLLHGGNKQTIKSGIYYYNFDGTSTQVPNELPQTVAAYNYLKSIIPNIVVGTALPSTYQTATTQVIIGQPIAGTYEANELQDRIDVITDIIRRGPDFAGDKSPINLTINPSEEATNAFNMLLANKAFIQAEVTAYIDSTSNTFDYSREKCFRDVGILVENISYDAAFGGNQKAVESGLAYYDGVISRISGQETQTISAIDYLTSLSRKVITNTTCTDLLAVGTSTTATHAQVINTALVGGDIADLSISNLFEIVTDIISNGPSEAPTTYVSSGPDQAFVSAETLLQANREFIQQDTLNYINNLIKQFPYSEIKCKRDTKLIVDAISQDLLYPTERMSQSTFAGLQYWNQDSYTGDIEAQLQPTINAVEYLKELSVKIIQNITPTDDLVDRYQFVETQNTSLEPATTNEVVIIENLYDNVLEILRGRKTGWTDRIVPNGDYTNFASVENAYALLMANKDYMAAEVVAYVNATHPDFTYSTSTCARDVGLITDSISFDLTHSGNRQSIQAGLYYYGFSTSTSSIHGQEDQTIAAFTRISELVNDILTNTPIVASTGTVERQIFKVTTATNVEISEVQRAISTITSIIENGPSIAAAPSGIAMTASSTATVLYAYELLQANRDFIADEVINYINSSYNSTSFQYNQEKCYRDVGLIVDAVSQDILLGGNQKSVEAGVSYWSAGYNAVTGQETTTTMAINHARDIALKVAANTTVTVQSGTILTQVINPFFQYGGDYMPQQAIKRNFNIITTIVEKGPLYAPPVYAGSGLFALTGLLGADVTISPMVTSVTTFDYDEALCRRDSNYILEGVYYDVGLGTNYNGITSGNAYRRGTVSSQEVINKELPQTTDAIKFLKTSTEVALASSTLAITRANTSFDSLLAILTDTGTPSLTFTNPATASAAQIAAKDQLIANREFIRDETVAWIQFQIANDIAPFVDFEYDWQKCYRDVGYLVDALTYDIIYGGNSAAVQAAEAYFTKSGESVILGETAQSVAAFNHMAEVVKSVIRNITVTATTGTNIDQVLEGSVASSIEVLVVDDLVGIITDVISSATIGVITATVYPSVSWATSGVQSAITNLAGSTSTIIDNMITFVDTTYANTYVVGLDTPTVGFGNNASVYFGETAIFPLNDSQVEELSLTLTGNSSTWNSRKVDPIGSMGGSLVDGAVISSRSPIQSFVYDAFTQVNQGGRGVHIINNGYAQLVSVFTIFCSVGVEVESGGIASIVNSNSNFGDICLKARGYGTRKFSGHIYNPVYKAYPESPDPSVATTFPDSEYFDQYYPTGFWPNNARVRVFLPDTEDRPHISLVMEVVPPETVVDYTGATIPQVNDQGFPGFLNAAPTLGTLTTGSITITGIDTDGIAVGNTVYIRDMNNSFTGTNGLLYADTGTVVTNIDYQSVTLSKALTSGGSDLDDENNNAYFDLYFCGNAYYTVLSSEVGDNPLYNRNGDEIPVGVNILSTASTGLATSQIAAHISSLQRLNQTVIQIIKNETVTKTTGNTATQTILPLVLGGGAAETFISQRFDDMIAIINAANLTAAEAVVPSSLRTKEGPTVAGAGSAITLIQENIEFLADEISAYVQDAFAFTPGTDYDDAKCQRDVKIILNRLIYDIETGGRYNSTMVGLSYWNRAGTYHLVQLGENVTRTDLFPDGSTVNFYQRSYMSASGYVFEYVGAGTNYGALPQRGVADPVQSKEVVMLDSGKVFFTSTDQNGDFRIGPGLVISQATGVLSGRTFTKSLFANMTPFILAIEQGGA